MEDAAQGEPIRHEVFEKPFKVEPQFEQWKTPKQYSGRPRWDRLPAKLPEKIKVWRVQRPEKRTHRSVVSRAYGFEDSPDAEILTPGVNFGKESGAVGVGRHGNILQWGFSAPPSEMTDAGRKFFLNCICYIRKFDGQAPLVHRRSSHRMNVINAALVTGAIKKESFRRSVMPTEALWTKYRDDPAGLTKYYESNYELIYRDKIWRVDFQLKSLGIQSNRRLSTLERLISLLADKKHADLARRLLSRYTTESFETRAKWQAWLTENRSRIYFSDFGGFKFRVAPKDYPIRTTPPWEEKVKAEMAKPS